MTSPVAELSHTRAVECVTGRGFLLFWYTPVTCYCSLPSTGSRVRSFSTSGAHRAALVQRRILWIAIRMLLPSGAPSLGGLTGLSSPDEPLLTRYCDSTLLIIAGSENLRSSNDSDDPACRFYWDMRNALIDGSPVDYRTVRDTSGGCLTLFAIPWHLMHSCSVTSHLYATDSPSAMTPVLTAASAERRQRTTDLPSAMTLVLLSHRLFVQRWLGTMTSFIKYRLMLSYRP